MTKKKYSTIELEGIDAGKQLVIDIFLHEGALRERERLVELLHKWQGVYMESGGPEGAAVAEFAQKVIDELELDIDTATPYDGQIEIVDVPKEGAMSDRPDYCCGVCPPIKGGGYDCTCRNNPRCTKHKGESK